MFDLVLYCSQNYMAALDLTLPYFANNSGAERVIVYTDEKDEEWRAKPHFDTKTTIEYRPLFPQSDDWIENVGRLPLAAEDYVNSVDDGRYFCSLAADIMILRSVREVFGLINDDRWLGIFRVDVENRTIPNVFYARVNAACRDMVKHWVRISQVYRDCKIGVEKDRAAYDQISFDFLVRSCYYDNTLPLNQSLLMNEADDLQRWWDSVKHHGHNVRTLHFKGGRWQNKDLVEKMLRLAEVSSEDDSERLASPCGPPGVAEVAHGGAVQR